MKTNALEIIAGNQKRKNLPTVSKSLIANARNDVTIPNYSNVLQTIDDTLLTRGRGKGLALYDELEKEGFAFSVLQKRKKTLLAREWAVEPGGDDKNDIAAADHIESVLKKIPFDSICEGLLDATLKGYAISEIVWKRDGKYIVPAKVVSHEQRRFVFDLDWNARLLTRENMSDGTLMPDKKFIVHRHGVKGNNAYGLGLGHKLFWPILFKREGVSFWLKFLEKFASPTVIGKAPIGMDDDQESKLLNTLAGIVQNSAVLVPMDTDVEFLEAARSGSVSYNEWVVYWDKQISIIVLGETLTTDIGNSGSRAASQTHENMLQMLVDSDGDLLADTLSETLIKWMTEYNFPGAAIPKVYRVRPKNEREAAEVRKVKAEADTEENKATIVIMMAASKIEDDKMAKAYMMSFSVISSKDDKVVDALVESRHELIVASEQDFDIGNALRGDKVTGPKKKDLTQDDAPISFAEEANARGSIVDQLGALATPLLESRTNDIKQVIDSATSLEAAAAALLELGASWKPETFANMLSGALDLAALTGREAVLVEMGQSTNAEFASFADADVFNQPFKEQIDYFDQKAPRPTNVWTDVMHGHHDRSFVVAGATDLAMLDDFQTAIGKAIKEGTTLTTFQKDFDRIVAKYGWAYKGERSWRAKTIFQTNIRTSYMAGRLKQMRDPDVVKARPYWEYRHGVTRSPKRPRAKHLAWDGKVLLHDDPFWLTHYPPNDWLCSCGVRTLSKADLGRRGKSGPDKAPDILLKPHLDKSAGTWTDLPDGVGYGWNYQPGDIWERGLVPSIVDSLVTKSAVTIDAVLPIAELVDIGSSFKAKKLPSGKPETFYINKFLAAFGAKPGKAVLFKDKAGGSVVISDELFRDAAGEYKVLKRGREVHIMQMAETIQDPDEIWLGVFETGVKVGDGAVERVVDRRYIRTDPKTGLVVIFEMTRNEWTGKTAFAPLKKNSTVSNLNAIDRRRGGKLLYKRDEK